MKSFLWRRLPLLFLIFLALLGTGLETAFYDQSLWPTKVPALALTGWALWRSRS